MAQLNSSQSPVIKTPRVILRALPPLHLDKRHMHRNAHILNMHMDLRADQVSKERHKTKGKYKPPDQLVQFHEKGFHKQRLVRFNSLPAGLLDFGKKTSLPAPLGIPQKRSDGEVLSISYPNRLLSLRGSLEKFHNARDVSNTKTRLCRKSTNRSDVPVDMCGTDVATSTESFSRGNNVLRSSIDSLKLKPTSESESQPTTTRRRIPSTRFRRKKGRMGSKFKRLAHFLSILFGLWKIHAARVKNFLDTNVDLMEYHEPVELMFDVTIFKADKQGAVSQETKRILLKTPVHRTEEEVKHVQVALRNYPTIAEYPIQMTKAMAQRSWLERFDQKRIIVQQSHPAMCYYIILSGSVIVSRMDSEYSVSRTVCFLNRGESFGELGLISNAPRQATVISKEPVELLVFSDEDYVEIFMGGGLKGGSDPFLSNLWCFEGWPTEIIRSHPMDAFLSYFKRNTVLVPNSKLSEWIYIVKSGSCTVLKKLHEVPPTTRKHETEIGDLREEQKQKIAKCENIIRAKNALRSTLVRRKQLQSLKLGIATNPISDAPGLMDYISLASMFNITKKSIVVDEDSNEQEDEDSAIGTKLSSLKQGATAFIKPKNTLTKSTESTRTEAESPEKVTGDGVVLMGEKKHEAARRRNLSSKGPFLSQTPFEDTPTILEETAAEEMQEVDGDIEAKHGVPVTSMDTVRPGSGEAPAETAQSEQKHPHGKVEPSIKDSQSSEDWAALLEQKPTEFKQEKKTIMDEINKNSTDRSGFVSVEDKEPMFVRVQTLTKGAVFGMADLVHCDQPTMSLISNGAECMLIKKKFYTDNASTHLLNTIRHETSPYPTQPEMQASLQEYVDWVNQKERTMRDTLVYNRRVRLNVHDARSSLNIKQEEIIKDYSIKLAGPLHG